MSLLLNIMNLEYNDVEDDELLDVEGFNKQEFLIKLIKIIA